MMRNMVLVFAMLMTFMLVNAVPSVAQMGMGDGPQGREKMRERIEDLRKVKLLDVLDLQGDQVEKFFVIYNKHQAKFREVQDKVDNTAKELQGAIGRGASDAELADKTLELRKQIKELERVIESRFDDLKPVLTTKQYAQYVVFEARFRDELQRMIMERMKKMRRD
jgi:hypothetical protein